MAAIRIQMWDGNAKVSNSRICFEGKAERHVHFFLCHVLVTQLHLGCFESKQG